MTVSARDSPVPGQMVVRARDDDPDWLYSRSLRCWSAVSLAQPPLLPYVRFRGPAWLVPIEGTWLVVARFDAVLAGHIGNETIDIVLLLGSAGPVWTWDASTLEPDTPSRFELLQASQ